MNANMKSRHHGIAVFHFGEIGWHAPSNAKGVASVIWHATPFGVPQSVPPKWNNGDAVT